MENGTSPLVTIRKAELRDLHILRQLWLAMLDEERTKPYYPAPRETDATYLTQDLATVVDMPHFAAWIAYDEREDGVGFVAIEQMSRRFGRPEVFCQFHAIYVVPNLRHHDVSLRLCMHLVPWCKDRQLTHVECDNQAGAHPPWWKTVGMPFRAARVHYTGLLDGLAAAIEEFTRRRSPVVEVEPAPQDADVAIETLPDEVDIT